MPPVAVRFNGGVNLPDTTSVLRNLVERVPEGVHRLPDGETGERATWIGYQLPRLLATPGLERVEGDPATAGPYGGGPTARLAEGTAPDTIAWADLGYAGEYEASYATFRQLRDEGVVPPGVRFQVEYPTPLAVSNLFHPTERTGSPRRTSVPCSPISTGCWQGSRTTTWLCSGTPPSRR